MDKCVYPESSALLHELRTFPDHKLIPQRVIYETAVEILREYEHGTADIETLGLENIKQYKNVLIDFLLGLTTLTQLKGVAYEKDHLCGYIR